MEQLEQSKRFILGLDILRNYDHDFGVAAIDFEVHIHIAQDYNIKKKDKNELKELGWSFDEECTAWVFAC